MKKLTAPIALGLSMLIATPAFAYEVQSGDTMSEIAAQKDVTLSQLSLANPSIKNLDLIYIGQQLNIPGEDKVVTENKPIEQKRTVVKNVEASPTKQKSQSNDSSFKTMTVEATAYTAYCNGCSGITRTGIDLRSNPNQKVIAVDPSVIPLGSKVWVDGYGMAIAGDTGGAIKGNRIDVFIPNRQKMNDFGRRTVQIKVYK